MSMPAAVEAVQSRIAEIVSLVQGASRTTSPAPAAASATSFAAELQTATGADTSALLGDGTVTGDEVANAAKKYEGVPYVFGGTTSSGLDCSGLIQRAFADMGVEVPRLVRDQEKIGTEVPSLAEAKPGDLIVTDGGNHISMYLGNNMVVHAPYPGRTVSVQKVWFGEEDITTIRRVVPSADSVPNAAGVQSSGLPAVGTSADPLAGLLSSVGGSGNSTAQQLLAARAALLAGSLS